MRPSRRARLRVALLARTTVVVALMIVVMPPITPAATAAAPAKVGLLLFGVPDAGVPQQTVVLREALRDRGWIEGQTIVYAARAARGGLNGGRDVIHELAPLATELVQQHVAVLVAFGNPAAQAARDATARLPIVMAGADNPVGWQLVASLAHPGGNLTGVTLDVQDQDLNAKRLELLKGVLPTVSRVAVTYTHSRNYHVEQLSRMEAVAPALGLAVRRVGLLGVEDLDRIFAGLQRHRVAALRIQADPVTDQWREQIAALALKYRLPTFLDTRSYVEAGGLLSYGPSPAEIQRRTATYVDRILRGASPADLPLEQPTTFELVINARTAKGLGLTIPHSILIRADAVLQ